MKSLKKAGGASLALLAISILLAGCAGGKSSSVPAGPTAGAPSTLTAPTTGGSTVTLTGIRQLQQVTGANSVTVYVVSSSVNGAGNIYNPVANCVNLPTTGSTTGTAVVNIPAPVGLDYVVFAASTGTCAAVTATTVLPSQVVQAVQNAASTFQAPTNLATAIVAGTVGGGTVVTTQTVFGANPNPVQVVPGGAALPATTAVALGFPLSVANTLAKTTASLSSTTAGLTSFQMDTVNEALQVNVTLTDVNGSPLPVNVTTTTPPTVNVTDTPITVLLVDNSAGSAAGTFTIGLLSSTGVVLAGGPGNAATLTAAANCPNTVAATAKCATFTYGTAGLAAPNFAGIPPAGSAFYVSSTGANQDSFQTATLTFAYQKQNIASIPITNQSQVQTLVNGGLAIPAAAAANLNGPLSLAVVGDATTNAGSLNFAQGAIEYTTTGAGAVAFTGAANTSTVNAGTYTNTAAVYGAATSAAIVTNNGSPATEPIYFTDTNCSATGVAGCTGQKTSIYQTISADISTGTAPAVVNVDPGQSIMTNNVAGGYAAGAIGLAYWSRAAVATGGTVSPGAFGSLFVVANNSVYRVDLNTNLAGGAGTTDTILAGPGVAGGGPNNVGCNNGAGLTASFGFGTAKYIPMAINQDPNLVTNAAAVTTVWVWDPNCNVIRQITGINSTTAGGGTVSNLPVTGLTGVTGLAYDAKTKLLYATTGNQIVSFSTTATTGTVFAGTTTAGTGSGLALQAYPLQFNVGNVTANAAGTAANTLFSGANITAANGALAANTDAAAQKTATVANYIAGLTGPTGIVYEGVKGYFYWLEPTQSAANIIRAAQ